MSTTSHDSETPAHGQQVITACAFIYDDREQDIKVFLPKRAATKKFLPNVYELPGGHIDFGESLEDGLKREIVEEFGVAIQLADPFAAFTYVNEVKGSHSVEVIYFAKLVNFASQIKLDLKDHSEYVWATEDELPYLYANQKSIADVEAQKVLRGFEILKSGFQPKYCNA